MVAVSAGERIPIAQVNVSVCPLVSGVPCRHAPWSVVGPDWKTMNPPTLALRPTHDARGPALWTVSFTL